MKTYLYNFDPVIPHFYIVKLGFTGVYFKPTIYVFEQIYGKYQNFYLKTLFLVVKFSIYLNRRVFVIKT